MSLVHSPQIITDGLVFAYDMQNTRKSWRGAPTTNLYADGDYSSGSLHPVRSGTWTIVSDPRNDQKKVLKVLPAGNNQYHGRDIIATVSTLYSFSVDVYASEDCNLTNFRLYGEQGAGGVSVPYDFAKRGTWQRLTFSGHAATTTNLRVLMYALASFTTGYILVSNLQVEQSANVSPFVNGSRSATQAVLDMTGKNTVTVNSLTYNRDGTVSFLDNGGFSMPSIDFANAQTVEIWLKPLEADGNRRNPYNQAYAGYGTWTHEPDGTITYFYGDGGADNTPYVGHGSSFTVAQNEIACVCTTRDLTTSWWYKNGVQSNSYAHAYGSLAATSGNITIGNGYAGAYYGDIYAVKLYNRALSAAEVKQNFNALRGRYGI